MTTIEKLQLFKAELERVQEIGENFLIGFFVFIQQNEILKKEFDYRLHYFKNLASNKDFTKIQNQLCENATAILKLTDNQKIIELQKKLNCKYKNQLKTGQDEVDLPELYQLALDKNNYYRLDESALNDYANKAYQVKKQYESITRLFNLIGYHIVKDKKSRFEFYKLIDEYNDGLLEFNQLISWLPARLNVNTFREFWNLCGLLVSPENYKSNIREKDFNRIKQHCKIVIGGLIDSLCNYKEIELPGFFLTEEKTSFYSIIEVLGNSEEREKIAKKAIDDDNEKQGLEEINAGEDDGWLVFHTESGLKLDFNRFSGAFKYDGGNGNNTYGSFAPETQEYIVLLCLLESATHLAKYTTLLKVLYKKEFPNPLVDYQTEMWCLQGIVKKIKHGLKILPKNENSNENIFETQKNNKAYRLKLVD